MAPSKKGTNDNVKVMVRVRPFNNKEITENGGTIPFCSVFPHSDTVLSAQNPEKKDQKYDFFFDQVFWSIPDEQLKAPIPFARQEEVYGACGKIALDALFDGFNGCIFAYGQTSSGKTHSMMGYQPPREQRGLTPRLCEELFERIEDKEAETAHMTQTVGTKRKIKHSVTVSFLEIYNEKVIDLLGAKKGGGDKDGEVVALVVQNDPKMGPVVKGLRTVPVTNWEEVNAQFELGTAHRSVAMTSMNAVSSRSHAIVQLTLLQEEMVGNVGNKQIKKERRSRVNLVDLAGSEKVERSQVVGQGLKEAININKSLTCLGRVIDLLVQNDSHIPYRDSQLTTLLMDSLGGNSRTMMLAALSPAAINFEETLSTLRYASRARQIVNVVKVNEDPSAALIRELQEQLEKLRTAAITGDFTGVDLGEGNAGVQANNLEGMISQLERRQVDDEAAEAQREAQWANEKDDIERKHAEQLGALQRDHDQLKMQHEEAVQQKERLDLDLRDTQKAAANQKLQFAARMAVKKEQEDKMAAEKKGLKRDLIAQRFRTASREIISDNREKQLTDKIAALEEKLTDAELQIDNMARNRGGYIGQIQPESDRLCEVCFEVPATWECAQCQEVTCDLCDANRHRSVQTRFHKRMSLFPQNLENGNPVCEFCGFRAAVMKCDSCQVGMLCNVCDDIVHRNQKRSYHHRHELDLSHFKTEGSVIGSQDARHTYARNVSNQGPSYTRRIAGAGYAGSQPGSVQRTPQSYTRTQGIAPPGAMAYY